jgi:hypothetical protein
VGGLRLTKSMSSCGGVLGRDSSCAGTGMCRDKSVASETSCGGRRKAKDRLKTVCIDLYTDVNHHLAPRHGHVR